MRNDVDHLPEVQQGELARVVNTLREEFSRAIVSATQPWKKNGKILKVILFGSYAREDWVDEPENGYQSDFDLLIIVSHEDLTDIADYWYIAEDRILHDAEIGRPVNIIVHTLHEVNQALEPASISGSISRATALRCTSCPTMRLRRPSRSPRRTRMRWRSAILRSRLSRLRNGSSWPKLPLEKERSGRGVTRRRSIFTKPPRQPTRAIY